MTASQPGRVGDRIGPFEVRELLGRGGFGHVYRAHDALARRDVALKICLKPAEASHLARFEREAQVCAALDHPGIVKIFTNGKQGDRPWMAYELVEEARSLSKALAERDRRDRILLLLEAIDAVAHAHTQGVVHRDLKADNILVGADGRARVADFGLALWVDGEVERLTNTGVMVGTLTHMAPEQYLSRRQKIGKPSDVWALGVILYEALTGRFPFPGSTAIELGAQICGGYFQTPRTIDPGIPEELEAVCLNALLVDPGARYADAAELAADLRRALDGQAVARRARSRTRTLAAGLVALLLVVGLGVVLGLRQPGVDEVGSTERAGVRDDQPDRAPPSADPQLAAMPRWFRSLPAAERPPHPLRAGLSASVTSGTYVNEPDGMELVWIAPVGTATGYFIGKYELTRGQYRRFLRAKRSEPHPSFSYRSGDAPELTLRHPAHGLTAAEARRYADWAGLRLPTEDEWLRAAGRRAGFPWGDTKPTATQANLRKGDRHPFTSRVGTFPDGATPAGCLDMIGNVWEWVVVSPLDRDAPCGLKGGSWLDRVGKVRLERTRWASNAPRSARVRATWGARFVRDP